MQSVEGGADYSFVQVMDAMERPRNGRSRSLLFTRVHPVFVQWWQKANNVSKYRETNPVLIHEKLSVEINLIVSTLLANHYVKATHFRSSTANIAIG